jgi:ABC-type tungstate transport system permease subunit
MVDPHLIRLCVVNTPQSSGLIDALMKDFEASSDYKVEVYSGNDVYDRARAGNADIITSHYGKAPVERFVLDGYGSWPRTVFSNQAAMIGPKRDSAHIRGFIANHLPGVTYLTNILWESAGEPTSPAGFSRPAYQRPTS